VKAEHKTQQASHSSRGWLTGVRGRLVLLVVVALLPAIGLILVIGGEQRQEAARQATDDALRVARAVAGQQQRCFENARQSLLALARAPAVQDLDAAACRPLFASRLGEDRMLVNLGLLGPAGQVLASAVPGPADVGRQPWVQQALASAGFTVGELEAGPGLSRPVFWCAQPVLTAAGRPRAMLYAWLDLRWLSRLAAEAGLPPEAVVQVLDASGRLVGRYPPGRGLSAGSLAAVRKTFPSGTLISREEDGVLWLSAVVPAGSLAQGQQIFAAVSMPLRVAFAPVNRRIARNLAALGGVVLLALAAAWVAGDFFLVRRLKRLADATQRLAAGEFGARTGLADTSGELGQLARAFDGMAATLENREAALQAAMRSLRESEERFRSLIENSLDVILVLDAECRLRYVSPSMEKVLGRPAAECLQRSLFDFVAAEDVDQLTAGLRAMIRQPGQSARFEFGMRHREGSWRHLEATGSNLLDRPEVAGLVLNCRDVTERKRIEAAFLESNERLGETIAELRAAEQQVVQQARLRALGQMASGIAHDFNNVLTTILGFSELLLLRAENRADEQKLRHYLELIHSSATDAAHIVGRLREFYREREAGEVFQPVDLPELARQAMALTQPFWKEQALARGCTIQFRLQLEPVPQVAGRSAELRQALTNLIFNAVDAMPQGGLITLRTMLAGGHAVLEVTDTGTGMTEEVRQRCLEPFFSTKGERGTGLGLAQVYGIVRRHEGFVTIRSRLGHGTTFSLHFPPLRAPATAPAPAAGRQGAPAAPVLDVLLVDDDLAVADVQAEFLRGDGHRVVIANSGPHALEQFAAGQFDLVITDRAMPGMSGDELARAIKERHPQIPVIMLTGFGDIMKAAGEHPAGVDVVLSKPVSLAVLRETVLRLVGGRAPRPPAGVAAGF